MPTVVVSGEECLSFECTSFEDVSVQNIIELVRGDLRPTLFLNNKPLSTVHKISLYATNEQFIHLHCKYFGLLGGKGGFGSLLRGQKSTKKTTNFSAMRDLSGRRIRHVENEKKLQEWSQEQIKKAEEDEKQKEEEGHKRLEEKRDQLAKIEKKLDIASNSLSSAVHKGLAKTGGKVFVAEKITEPAEEEKKRKREDVEQKPNKKKKNMFATEFDLSSDEE
jgi:hypothetical protein